MKKRLLALILSVTMLMGLFPVGVFAADDGNGTEPTAVFEVSKETVNYSDKTVSLQIELKNNPGIAGMKLVLEFENDAFEVAVDEETGLCDAKLSNDFLGKYSFMPGEKGKSPFNMVFYGPSNIKTNGVLVNVKFNIKDTAKVGTHTISLKAEEAADNSENNVKTTVVNGEIKILGSEFSDKIALSDDKAIYDGAKHSLEISEKNLLPKGAEVKYTCDGEEFDGATDPGTYDITAVVSAPGYTEKTLDATLTIEKRTLSASVGVGAREYDGTKDVNFTTKEISGIVDGDDVECEIIAEMASADAGKNIKVNIEFALTGEDAHKYNPPKTPSVKGTINKRKITVTANGSKKVGDADPVMIPEITSGTLVGMDTFSGSPSRKKGETAGTYDTTKGTLSLPSNYELDFVAGTFEITNKKAQSVTVKINKNSVVYGDTDSVFMTVDADEDNSADGAKDNIRYTSSNTNVATVDGNGKITVAGAGTTAIKAVIAGDDTYADFEESVSFTVEKRKITVKADDKSKKVGATDPKLTYSLDGSVADGDNLVVNLTRKTGEKKGTYEIAVSYTVTNSASYDVTTKNGVFTISEKFKQENVSVSGIPSEVTYGDTSSFTIDVSSTDESELLGEVTIVSSDSSVIEITSGTAKIKNAGNAVITVKVKGNEDYEDFVYNSTVKVKKRPVEITANNQSKYEKQQDPELSYEITKGKVVDGDTLSVVLTREKGETAGKKYAIKLGSVIGGENYDITFIPGNLEILKKSDRKYTFTAPTSAEYGDKDLKWSVTDEENKPVDGVRVTSDNTAVAKVSDDGKIEICSVGKAKLTASCPESTEYNEWSKSITLNVAKRSLTITAKDTFKKVGNADPVLEYSLDGSVVDGDNLVVTLTRKKGEKVGSYDIVVSYTLDNEENYNVTAKNGTFKITEKVPQTITAPEKASLTYGDEAFDLGAVSSLEGSEITYTVGDENVVKYNETTKKFDIVGAGKTEISLFADGNDTYTSANAKTDVTVSKASLTVNVVPNKDSYTYGEKATFDVSYSGFVKGETEEVLTKKAQVSANVSAVGSYKIKASGAEAKNYEFVYETCNVTVNKIQIGLEDIRLFNVKLTGEKNKKLDIIDYTLSGNIQKNDEVKFVVSAELKQNITEAGRYYAKVTVTMTGSDKSNYELVNGGKYGYDEDIYFVDVAEDYGAEEILSQIEYLFENMVLSGTDDGIYLPELPDGYRIYVEDPGEVLDENGKRIAEGNGTGSLKIFVEETKTDGEKASIEKSFETQPLSKFNVTVTAENGTVTGEGEYTVIDEITLEAVPAGKYSFSHWELDGKKISTSKKFTFKLSDVYDCDGDLAITAVFKNASSGGGGGGGGGGSDSEPPVYTVTFEIGDGKTETAKIEKNEKVAKPASPEKDGFEFGGWFTDEKLTTEYDFDSKVTKNFTLYAKWIEKSDDKDDDKKDDNGENTDNGDDEKKDEEYINPFSDVDENEWYAKYVEYVTKMGLFNGITPTQFGPYATITRGMLVTVLYRAEGEPEVETDSQFTDVDENEYYAKAVAWAKANGIVNGVSQDEFAPGDNITREQIATMIYNYAIYKDMDVSVGEETNILSYEDFEEVSEYAVSALCYTCGEGLIKGRTESTLNPRETATRAETATILARFFGFEG